MIRKLIYSLCILTLTLSCKVNTSKTTESIKSQKVNFDYFSARAKIKIGKYNVLLNLRIKQDSAVWINLSNTAVGKIGKALIKQDSIYVLRDYKAKEYYADAVTQLQNRIGYPVSLEMLTNIFLGQMPLKALDNAEVSKKGNEISIIQKEKLFTIENLLDAKTNKLTKLKIYQSQKTDFLEINYENYLPVDNHFIPQLITLKTNADKGIVGDYKEVTVIIQKSKFISEPVSFPFNVSSKYVHKTL